MTWQPSGENHPAQHDGAPGALRVLAVTAVCIGVTALAVVTFVLSYADIRAVALQAGIQPNYAKAYPFLLDAMLVIALAAVLALRGAGVPSRMLSWLTLLAVLGAAAGAGALHATGRTLPHNAAATTAAVLPWALVLIAFVLLLAMLRHVRLRRRIARSRVQLPYAVTVAPVPDLPVPSQPQLAESVPALPARTPQPWHLASIVPGFTSQLVSSAAAGAAAGAAAAEDRPRVQDGTAPDGADPLQAGTDWEAAAVEEPEPVAQAAPQDTRPESGLPEGTSHAEAETDLPAIAAEPAVQTGQAEPQTEEPVADAGQPTAVQTAGGDDDDDMPVFHRV